MIAARDDLTLIERRLESVAAQKPGYADRFAFYKTILAFLFEKRPSVIDGHKLGEEEARMRIEGGFPLIDRSRLFPKLDKPAEIAKGLLALVEEEKRLPDSMYENIRLRLKEGLWAEDAGRFMETLEQPDHADWEPEESELWRFLVHNALKPALEAHAGRLSGMAVLTEWREGRCPICGGGPAIEAFLGEEGRRLLLCHLCGHQWPYRRVSCPFCGNIDHEKLNYLSFDEEPWYRIDVCRSCRGYLKGVEERKLPSPLMLEAEDLATPHFDLVAEKEGFIKPFPNILGLSK